jgi:hypothetical protein
MFEFLFQRFNTFYERCFFKFGIILANYYKQVIIFAFTLNAILSLGLLKIKIINNADELFQIKNSKAVEDELLIKSLFQKNNLKENFYLYQLTDLGTGAEVNFNRKTTSSNSDNANLLSKEYFEEILRIHEYIIGNVTALGNDGKSVGYDDLCAKRFGKCWIEGLDVLNFEFLDYLKEIGRLNKSLVDQNLYIGRNGVTDLLFTLGKDFGFVQSRPYAHTFKLRYSLRSDASNISETDRAWELEFLKHIVSLKSDLIDIKYGISQSIVYEIDANIKFDMYLIVATFVLISLFATLFMSINTTLITSPGIMLPSAGIFSALFGISSSFGFLALCGFDACMLVYVLPFLVMGE